VDARSRHRGWNRRVIRAAVRGSRNAGFSGPDMVFVDRRTPATRSEFVAPAGGAPKPICEPGRWRVRSANAGGSVRAERGCLSGVNRPGVSVVLTTHRQSAG
jgi:hypothetical protein